MVTQQSNPPVVEGRSLDEQLADIAPLVQQDSVLAAQRLRQLVAHAASCGNVAIEAEAAYLCARAEVNNGHLGEALALIEQARHRWTAIGDLLAAWRTDLGRMHVLDDLGRHTEAMEVGSSLIATVERAQVDPDDTEQATWLRAAALENVGVGHGYLGEHDRALEAYAQAEAAYRTLGYEEDIPRPMGNRGVELVELGRYAEAVDVLRTASAGFEANDDDLFSAKCLAYQARAHVMLGDHIAAASATAQADRYLEGLTTSTEYARTQLVRAETLRWLNLLEESHALYDSIITQFSDAGMPHDLADAHYGAALVLAGLGFIDDAGTSLAEAERLFAEVEAEPMRAACMVARAQLADPVDAQRLCATALEVLIESGRSADVVAAHLRLAEVAERHDEAKGQLDAAQALLSANRSPELEWRVLFEKGRWHHRSGSFDDARSAMLEALEIINQMRTSVAVEHHRLLFMGTRSAVIDCLIDLELGAGNTSAAYDLSERTRARTLVERMSGELVASFAVPTVELDEIYTELLSAPTRAATDLLVRARSLERDTLSSAVAGTPMRAAGTVVDIDADAVIMYQRLDDELLAFLEVGGELTVVRHLASVAEVRYLLHQLDAQWRRFEDPGLAARQHSHLLAATIDILQQLHIRLLAGLPQVLDLDSAVFIPCPPLGNVPFAALHDGTCHMVERLTSTVAPSRIVARHAAERSKGSYQRCLALGVPDESTPNVETEVRAVARLADTATVLIGPDASLDALRGHAPEADVLHIACHGVDRPDSPLFSAVRLGDRWLTAAEVAALELDGQLVILSACSSGRQFGSGNSGELVGLPRAFLAAGAGGVVVNLWQVDDSSAEQLMTQLHRNLGTQSPADALRTAQLSVLSDRPHPYHWGPAVLYGSPWPKEQS